MAQSVVIIEDETTLAANIAVYLEKHSYEVHPAANAQHGLKLCETVCPDVVLLDLTLPDGDGLELLPRLRPLARAGTAAVLVASQAGHFARDGAIAGLTALLDDPLAPDLVERIAALDDGLMTPGGAYGGSKYGVMRLAEREAAAWGAAGARIVSLSPGIIDTGMGQQEYAQQPFMATMVERTPLGRMGRDDEIASAVGFLCSEAASFVTGTDLLVDGGSTQAVRALLPGGEG